MRSMPPIDRTHLAALLDRERATYAREHPRARELHASAGQRREVVGEHENAFHIALSFPLV